MSEVPTPTREATETEDRYSQIYIHGAFHTYLAKDTTLRTFAKTMKAAGYYQTGFTIGGAYMKVNFAKLEETK